MSVWHRLPLLRLIIPFLCGIIVSIQADREIHVPWWVFIAVFMAVAAFLKWPKVLFPYRYRWMMGTVVQVLMFLLGFELTIRNTVKFNPDYFPGEIAADSSQFYIADVAEPVVVKDKTVKVIVSVRSVRVHDKCRAVSGNGLIYFTKDSLSAMLEYGDRLAVNADWQEISGPRNPYEFDYRKYLSQRGIYLQAFVKRRQWKLIAHDKGNLLYKTAWSWREYLVGILKKNKLSGDELAVGGAILLGEYQNFDPELQRAYSGAGVTHILSVSGLHVGIVFYVFNSILFFLNRNRKTKLIKAILLILMTWFYALLTGLSPPVERAAAMFTFIIIGQAIHRKSHILNTLSASALLLLLINPFLVMDIGFQLTYLAVAGIVLLEKPVYELTAMPNKWMDKVWKLVAVTIAAQLTTGPLAIYNFHQFPVYFIPANLVIIPWSTVVMYSGMGALVFSPAAVVCVWVTSLFSWSILVMNKIIFFVEALPLSVMRELSLTSLECLGMYFLVATGAMFLVQRKGIWLICLMVVMLFTGFSLMFRGIGYDRQHKFLVYCIRKADAIGFTDGRTHLLLSDSALLADGQTQKQHFSGLWTNWGIREKLMMSFSDSVLPGMTGHLWKKGDYLQFHGQRIVLVRETITGIYPEKPMDVDYLVLMGNPKNNIESIARFYKPKVVIISASCRQYAVKKWIVDCERRGMKYYDVTMNGAYVTVL